MRVGGEKLGERGGEGRVTNQVGDGRDERAGPEACWPQTLGRWRGRTQIKGHHGNPRDGETCGLWGRTELDMTEVTWQEQQQQNR